MTATKAGFLERLQRIAPKLVPYLTNEERHKVEARLAHVADQIQPDDPHANAQGKPAPKDPLQWLRTMFPAHFDLPFAKHHEEFWRKVWGVGRDDKPRADVEIWPRGGGKTAGCEAAVVMAGVRGKRKYVLYVRRTQARADDSVNNIARLLESKAINDHYPEHSRRFVGKFGKPGEWRRSRVRTAGGLTVDALGLDTAARGAKMEEQRPDMIIFDDIDESLDGPHITAKKLEIIKSAIIPAGSSNRWIVGVQNLIKRHGVFSQLADGSADFLTDRKVSGPIPAVHNLQWKWGEHPVTKHRCGIIIGGTATWAGQNLETCQQLIYDVGIATFRRECQHDVMKRGEGVALRFDPERHPVDMTLAQAKELCALGRVFGGVDFGFWRFGFTLWAVDRSATVTRIDEYFAQNMDEQRSLTDRAMAMHYMAEQYGLGVEKPFPIWGDAANPTDIHELNQIFKRGWLDPDTGQKVVSKLRVVAVAMENKLRKTSVDRINDLLDATRLRFRKLDPYEWRHHQTTDNPEGTPLEGSRLLWEIDQWSFPVPKPGEPQEQNPDDETADGADMIASMRYGIMSFWSAAKGLMEFGKIDDDRAEHFDVAKRRFVEAPHAADLLTEPSGRRSSAVRAPRPRIGGRR